MLSRQLADFVLSLKYNELPSSVKKMTLDCFLDWMGSAIRGSQEPPAQKVFKVLKDQGGKEDASFIGFTEKGPSIAVALLNGVSSHTVEMDDLHRGSIFHPAAPIISAALAAAEKIEASGEKLLEGIVAGYEVGIRIGEAVTPSHYYYWHTTGTCGAFGAAAAAGKILNLSVDELVWALGSAGTQAAGLWEFHHDAAMSKHLHAGKAAQNGLLSALLAVEGFTAASQILEGEKGFFRAFAPQFDANKAVAGLGQEYKILENSFKLHASCRHTHGGVDLALELGEEGITPTEIEEIVYKTYSSAVDLVAQNSCETAFKSKFSLPYCGAAALVFGRLGLEEFNDENLNNYLVREIMQVSRVEADSWAEEGYPHKWRTRLECKLKDGTLVVKETESPRGDPENPPNFDELDNKFIDLASALYTKEKAQTLLDNIKKLSQLSKVQELF